MTIEERAKEKFPTAYDIDTPIEVVMEKDAYVQGATDQEKIDIQKAVKWLKETYIEQYLNTICNGGYEQHELNNDFFNDFIQAMKGE